MRKYRAPCAQTTVNEKRKNEKEVNKKINNKRGQQGINKVEGTTGKVRGKKKCVCVTWTREKRNREAMT